MSGKRKPLLSPAPQFIQALFRPPLGLDLLIAIFVATGGYANSLRAFRAGEELPGWLWFATALGAGFLSVTKVWVQASEKKDPPGYHELVGCLNVLHAQLGIGMPSHHWHRLTVYVPTLDRNELTQFTEYIGFESDEVHRGRRILIASGIVGLAFRTKEMNLIRHVQGTYEDMIRMMVASLGFTESEALLTNKDCKSWLAAPITIRGVVEAVVYADSTDPGFFTKDRQSLISGGCAGIAAFLGRR